MTYRIVWEPEALAMAQKYGAGDRAGIEQVFQAVDLLADNPRPAGAFTVGSSGCFYRGEVEPRIRSVGEPAVLR
ncbi:type II toxin-antitoxin system RelE/ParE family toxin [Kitasatospora cineracea]|uniref:type II toxin-antitoxin system RelE family toxin n=1 Tax=Kitasatospora cineracea TaxID=88074 RepID=UPI0036D7EAD0